MSRERAQFAKRALNPDPEPWFLTLGSMNPDPDPWSQVDQTLKRIRKSCLAMETLNAEIKKLDKDMGKTHRGLDLIQNVDNTLQEFILKGIKKKADMNEMEELKKRRQLVREIDNIKVSAWFIGTNLRP